ncbi:hypothetical protein VM1G_09427 [Cytospora mali]|uniref:Uncharacterized protein n=1 Tax=Cytospora mali TaxID=578113 RepID=A0A194WBX6_CYTMA|nr:hypothetical protein VM1G_09427 [Valsa mali]
MFKTRTRPYMQSDDSTRVSSMSSVAPQVVEEPADAHSNGDEQGNSPNGFRTDLLKTCGVTDFIVRVSSRLRTIQPSEQRARLRSWFFDLVRGLSLDVNVQPPYDLAAATRLREFLEGAGLGENLVLDFEKLLIEVSNEARKRREEAEMAAKQLEEERRKKAEWDMIETSDAEEEWEIL